MAASRARRVSGWASQEASVSGRWNEKTRRELEDFLVRNASTRSRLAGEGDPPRLTASAWFRREHRKVPESLWRDARVKSASNCSACHGRAEQGSYRGREIALPELRKRERD